MTERDVVTLRGLRKAYRTRVVVDGLDLDVPAGEIVGRRPGRRRWPGLARCPARE